MSPFKRRFTAFFGVYQWLAIIVLSYTLICGLDYGDVVEYKATRMITPKVKQGEHLKVRYSFQRLRTCELMRIRLIIDGSGVHHEVSREYFPGYGNVTEPGNAEEMEVKVKIDPDFTPGNARYRVIMSYECPIRVGPLTITNIFSQFTPKVVVMPDLRFVILALNE